jgi:thiol:disulfide interchange protein DsbD
MLTLIGGGAATITAAKRSGGASSLPTDRPIGSVEGGWENYSPTRVAELQEQGIPVFVDFTAKWCLICQANKVTLHSADIQQAFQDKHVVTMEADWTKRDPTITKQLDQLGRSGVPVYVLYPGVAGEPPYILPQTLSSQVVKEYLNKLPVSQTVVSVDLEPEQQGEG